MTTETYIVDFKTKNISFLKLHAYLRNRGVKNNKFFLRLYNKNLQGVNPHSPTITRQQKDWVLAEIKQNPYYYLREVALISTPAGKSKFILHPGNLAITWAIFNSFDQLSLLPRQQFKTVSIAAALTWVYDFGAENTQMLFGNKSLGDAANNLSRFKDVRYNHPEYLKQAIIRPASDIDNQESIKSALTNNTIKIAGQPKTVAEADKQGKYTLPLHY